MWFILSPELPDFSPELSSAIPWESDHVSVTLPPLDSMKGIYDSTIFHDRVTWSSPVRECKRSRGLGGREISSDRGQRGWCGGTHPRPSPVRESVSRGLKSARRVSVSDEKRPIEKPPARVYGRYTSEPVSLSTGVVGPVVILKTLKVVILSQVCVCL